LNGDFEKVVKKVKSFFKRDPKAQNTRLETGRRFLEESLRVDPDRAEPRIYLGFCFMVSRRYDQARDQFRRVLALPDVSEENQMIAFQNLGLLYVSETKYEEAVSCFQEIEKSGIINRHPSFYSVLTKLAMAHAKAANFDQSIEYFKKIVRKFPTKVVDVRKELYSMETFQNLLRSDRVFRKTLEQRIPALFAS
jgi:tetratricopeptide (TPR) repeat protein